jgi:hypothetical protein
MLIYTTSLSEIMNIQMRKESKMKKKLKWQENFYLIPLQMKEKD